MIILRCSHDVSGCLSSALPVCDLQLSVRGLLEILLTTIVIVVLTLRVAAIDIVSFIRRGECAYLAGIYQDLPIILHVPLTVELGL